MDERPKVIVLCGSTRFYAAFQEANYRETMAGRIVLSVGFYPHAQDEMHGEERGCTPEQKAALDELHKRKIDLADEALILNVPQPWCPSCRMHCFELAGRSRCCDQPVQMRGYVGDSTRSEIEYARRHGKPIRWLNPEQKDGG